MPFQIARYSVTYKQFQAFIDSPDGYPNREINWFEGLAASDEDKRVEHQRFKFPNHPRETVNWYEAIAFCAWDGGFLPTETEWHYAASGGSAQRAYPWSSPAGDLACG